MREALRALAGKLEELAGPDDVRLFDVPGAPRPDEDTPAPPRLMAMWDSTLIAYTDRSRLMPPEYRPHVIRRNGDVLVDGYVAGVWRPVEEGIAVTAFCRVPDEAWGALADEAGALMTFLADRDPAPYRRTATGGVHLPPPRCD